MNDNGNVKMGTDRTKLDFYIKSKIMIHIELNNKTFLNARIIKKVDDSVYEIAERKYGLMHLFVEDIYNISEYQEVSR